MRPGLPIAVLLIAALLWGVSWWPLKFFHARGVDGPALILVAYGSVALALAPFLWRERRAYPREKGLAWLMVALGGYANLAFAEAMILGDVVRAMMLFYLAPVWGVFGGALFLRERIDTLRAVGVMLALAGAFLVLGGARVFVAPPSAIDWLALTSGMAFALNNVACRAAQSVPTATKSGVIFVGCTFMAAALLYGEGRSLPTVDAGTWGALIAFGLCWLLLATLATQWAVTRMEAGRASVILITELLAAVVSATLIGGETLSRDELAGGALIFTAALLEARRAE